VALTTDATASATQLRRVSLTPTPPSECLPRLLFVDCNVSEFLQHRIVFAHMLREAGFDVHAALPREPGVKAISLQGIVGHPFHLQRKSTRLADEMRSFMSMLRLYRRLRPTLVHHIGLKPALYGGIAARILSVPAAVNTLTGLGYLFTRDTLAVRGLRLAVARGLRFSFGHRNQCLILQNPDDRDRLIASRVVLGNRAVVIKGSGVDLSLFIPKPEPVGPPVVLMGSRLLWEKGVGEFVAAARAIRGRGISARFVLAGEPDSGHPDAVPVAALEHWRDVGDLEWVGWRHDMPVLISQSHIVCLPSHYGEGIPRVLLEAAASGRPIVTTDSVGCREVVRHGQNGLLVPVGDRDALTGAIMQLIENATLRAAMGSRGRQMAALEFSLEQVMDATLAVYDSLLPQPLRLRLPRKGDSNRACTSSM